MMRYIIVLLSAFALLAPSSSQGQEQGITFIKGKAWADILAQAKEEDKIIFMDAYTTWCGPCKLMSKKTFPEASVGEFYNKNFLNVKMDMEKGEGPELARRYGVRAYPTLLFIDADGNLVHRKAGYLKPDAFLELGKEALSPEGTVSYLRKQYEGGNRSPKFLRSYTQTLYDAADGGYKAVAQDYLATQSDWSSPENMEFLFQFTEDTESDAFDYMVKEREAFEEKFGKPLVTQKIQGLIYNKIYYSDPQPSLEEIKGIFERYFPGESDVLFANFKMSYYRQQGDRQGYAQAAVERFDNYPVKNYSELNEAAWTFYQVISDEPLLEKALGWAKKSVKMQKRYENLDTVAHLYHKLGNEKKAKCYAKKAIRKAKKDKEDYSVTQELLDEIKGE